MKPIFKEDLDEELLKELFDSDENCLKFISEVKWGDGFICRKCGNLNYCDGKTLYSRRCTKCKTDESATAHTLFHNCKFPVSKAFYIAYQVCKEGKDISTYEYSRQLAVRQMTCWKFKKKIQQCLLRRKSMTQEQVLTIQTLMLGDYE